MEQCRTTIGNAFAAVALCLVLLMCPCCVGLPGKPATPGAPLNELTSALLDPFGGVDPEQVTRVNSDVTLLRHRIVPASAVAGKRALTLEDCRSIALANNLDLQVARMEEITKQSIQYSNKTKLLPHVLFSGDLSQRDNPSFAYSDVLGQEGRPPSGPSSTGVTSYSTGHERSTWRYVLETRWSPTDAALAYYLSKSSINDRLKAHYQKLRVTQKLIATVDGAFFRLLALQECLPLAEQLAATRATVAGKIRRAFDKKLLNVDEFNKTQQNAIRGRRILGKVRNEIQKQRNILASAMGFSPDQCQDGGFYVVGQLEPPCFAMKLCDIELIAVRNRPEAVDAGLAHLNSTYDLKRSIVKYWPKVSGFWRYTRDKDKFLYNKDWKEVGISVYFDLVDWLTNVDEFRAARSNAGKTQREMGAVALAITAQVRLSALQYFDSLDELRSTQEALGAMNEVMGVVEKRAAKEDLDRLTLEDARANLLQNKIDMTKSLGEANATFGELQGTMGTNYREPIAPAGGASG
jgi:outer membrane protein TolC